MQMLHHQPPTTSYSFINIHDSFINILFGKDSCIIIDMFHQFFNRFWLCFLDVLVTGTPEPIVKWQHVRWLWRPNNFHFIADCPVLKFFCQPISNFLTWQLSRMNIELLFKVPLNRNQRAVFSRIPRTKDYPFLLLFGKLTQTAPFLKWTKLKYFFRNGPKYF